MRIAMPSNTGIVRTDIADLITRAKGLDASFDAYGADRHATAYAYADNLAAGATYYPPAHVEVQTAYASTTNALSVDQNNNSLYPGKPNNFGFFGSTAMDGSTIGYKNGSGANVALRLHGLLWS